MKRYTDNIEVICIKLFSEVSVDSDSSLGVPWSFYDEGLPEGKRGPSGIGHPGRTGHPKPTTSGHHDRLESTTKS